MTAVEAFTGVCPIRRVWTPGLLEAHLWWWRDLTRWRNGGVQDEEIGGLSFPAYMALALNHDPARRRSLLRRWRDRELISRFAPANRYVPAFAHPRLARDPEAERRFKKAGFAARGRFDIGELKKAAARDGVIELAGVTVDVRYPHAAHKLLDSIMTAYRKKFGLAVKSRHLAKRGEERWLDLFNCVEQLDLMTLASKDLGHDSEANIRRHRRLLESAVMEERPFLV